MINSRTKIAQNIRNSYVGNVYGLFFTLAFVVY